MKALMKEIKKELRLVKKNIEEAVETHIMDIKKCALKDVTPKNIEALEDIFMDLKYDIDVELEKLV